MRISIYFKQYWSSSSFLALRRHTLQIILWFALFRYYVEENTGESRWDPPPLPRSGAALSLLRAPSFSASSLPPSVAAKQAAQAAAAAQQQAAAAAQLAAKQQALKEQALQQQQALLLLQQQQQQHQQALQQQQAGGGTPPSRALGVLEAAIRGGDVAGVRALVLADESLLQQVRSDSGCDDDAIVVVLLMISFLLFKFSSLSLSRLFLSNRRPLVVDAFLSWWIATKACWWKWSAS